MLYTNEFITFEHENEHDLEHTLAHKKDFSVPKIYNANGNLAKRWYVYFSFRDPKTGRLKRMKNIYGAANSHKNKEDRLALLTRYRRRVLKLLQEGYNPYIDNTEFHKNRLAKKSEIPAPVEQPKIVPVDKPLPTEVKIEAPQPLKQKQKEKVADKMTIREAFDFSLELKAKVINERSLQDYSYSTNAVVKWLKENKPKIKTIDQFTKKVALEFLNSVLLKTSSRNRNNYRLNLSSLMQTLEDNEIIDSNPIRKIPVLKSTPTRNKTYTTQQQENIFSYLEKEDPILLLYIKFISYNLLRPVEVCRLKIKDFDLKNNTIQFKAKNSPLKTKLIPKILLKELPDLSKLNPENFLFTPIKIGGAWDASENNRRDHFSKRFKTVVKKHFKLDENHALYSFRHTFITKLYRALLENSSPHAAKSELMGITGHASMDALEKYLRDIDAELPNDYSDLL
ncbi:tyrosine-type recombinase/integrase [Algibacter sp. L1A34]|uniref:tyrosine-type recombinase/integrase n=1 Tax=Algibacter sp. L1A34 TaxID=2686365 RepID=UPI00131C3DA5|nr:tyrosine-type recombinase/integrase [Algibacter sp. L1A34]